MIKLCILVYISTVTYVYAAVAIYPYEPKPAEFADQEGCYIEHLNRVLPYNEPYYPKDGKSCLQYTCGTNNETHLFSCGVVGLPPECELVHDYSLDYPKCCGEVVCKPTTTPEEPTEPPCVTVTTAPPPTTTKPPTKRPCDTKPTKPQPPTPVKPPTEPQPPTPVKPPTEPQPPTPVKPPTEPQPLTPVKPPTKPPCGTKSQPSDLSESQPQPGLSETKVKEPIIKRPVEQPEC